MEFVDLYSKISDQNGYLKDAYSNDGVHLSTRGYKVVAQTVFESTRKLF
jgi:lysophospholipase L1-like esterase